MAPSCSLPTTTTSSTKSLRASGTSKPARSKTSRVPTKNTWPTPRKKPRSYPHEHPLKSIRATFVVIAAIAFRGMLLSSFEEVTSDGVQSAVPPLIGTNARASTVNSASPEAGAVKLTPDETNTPTCGLLAGTTRVYFAQFAFTGLPVGQFVFASAEIGPVESTARVAPTA